MRGSLKAMRYYAALLKRSKVKTVEVQCSVILVNYIRRTMTNFENTQEQGSRILIVEDDERLATLTKDYLESNGLSVSIEDRKSVV